MATQYSFSRNERVYLQRQPTFGTIPNAGGSASVGNSNACRFMHVTLNNDVALLEREDKTGTRSQEGMTGGRRFAHWSIQMDVAGNGTAGVVPDCDPILQALFGQTATVGTGSFAVSASTDATPIVVTSAAHGITSGTFEVVTVAGHTTNIAANGTWLAYAASTTTLSLVGSVGSGAGAGSSGTVSRVKVTYNLTDDILLFTLWSFRTASDGTTGIDQRVGNSCTATEATFNVNQDVANWSANGDGFWVADSKNFASLDSYQKGGLTNWPVEPTTPVTNGSIVPGFTGRFVAWESASEITAAAFASGAQTFPTIRNATIRMQTTNQMVRDTFGSYYPTLTQGGVRNIGLSFGVYDDDSTQVNNLKLWADQKLRVDFVINLGTVVGNTWVHYLKNVYLASHQIGDQQLRFDANFGESRATTTTLAVRDEYSLSIA